MTGGGRLGLADDHDVHVDGRRPLRHKDNPQVKAFVEGATAAAVGALRGAAVVLTRQVMVDWITVAIGVLTLAALLQFKVKEPYVVLACAAVGILLH